jgi:hypothetical protein
VSASASTAVTVPTFEFTLDLTSPEDAYMKGQRTVLLEAPLNKTDIVVTLRWGAGVG